MAVGAPLVPAPVPSVAAALGTEAELVPTPPQGVVERLAAAAPLSAVFDAFCGSKIQNFIHVSSRLTFRSMLRNIRHSRGTSKDLLDYWETS